MKIPVKPTKVLCKRTMAIGKNYYWNNESSPPARHPHENRMMIEGVWYDVVPNQYYKWDEEKRNFSFSIIDNQGSLHPFSMYTEEDKVNWYDGCINYGPNDYSKWFYTPEELEQLEKGTFHLIEDVFIKPGNLHWVKTKEDKWIIAQCTSKLAVHGKFYWQIIGTDTQKICYDFKEIGEQVISHEKQKEEQEKKEALEEFTDEIAILMDSINKNDPDIEYPSIQYIIPFVNNAWDKYMDIELEYLGDF